MGKRSKTAQDAYDIAKPVAERMGLDLVDAEYKKEGKSTFLRLFVDKKGGIGIDECEAFSREVDPILDENMKHDADFFEVSSPGLLRPLQEISDYLRYEGEQADVSFYVEKECGKNCTVRIAGADEKTETVVFAKEDGTEFTAGLKEISKAVRHIEF